MTAAAPTPAEAATELPKLRTDLQVTMVAGSDHGFPSAIVTDPVRASYFRLSWPESGIFIAWQQAGTAQGIAEILRRTFGMDVAGPQISSAVEFALRHQLTVGDQNGSWHGAAKMRAARKNSLLGRAMHNYLFFRIPLVRPEPWLTYLLPRLSFVYSKVFWVILALLALFGTQLAVRQWTALLVTANDALRIESAAIYGVALLVLKAIHELGHALTTARYGCRVPSMGIAFMLGTPVFYTDTTDSWRLARRSQRLAVVFAGVAAEMIVAVAAIVVWCFLADGPMRTVCFALSTASITVSLTINLNPFMRYDGYYALSDYLGVPNLQSRAFALAAWRWREMLFGLGHPPPEQIETRLQKTLVRYALLTAVYRLFLYLGIAYLVYVIAGKAIGIVLGLFELAIFIALPVAQEVAVWWSLRDEILRKRRIGWTSAAMACCLAAMVIPWMSSVEVPAVIIAGREEPVHLPFPSRLTTIAVTHGQLVRAGDVLFAADEPGLENERERAILEQHALEIRAGRLSASDKEREQRFSVESQLERARRKVAALGRRLDQLVIRAPFDGRIADLDPGLSTGIWLDGKEPLARLVSAGKLTARGMIAETDVARVKGRTRALFVPDDAGQPSLELTVAAIAPAGTGRLAEPVLADRHGGPVAVGETRGELVTRHGYFEVTFAERDKPVTQVVRGIARFDAEPVSPAAVLWQKIARVAVREQGF